MTLEYRIDLELLYGKIAKDIYRMGVSLSCKQCGRHKDLRVVDIANYLYNGWPKHCDETMHLVTDEPVGHDLSYQGA